MEDHEITNTNTEKAYCCSNYPQTEAALIAKFDLVLETVQLLAAVIMIVVIATKVVPVPVDVAIQHSESNRTVTNDPSYFFHWPREPQLIVLSLLVVGCVLRIVISAILLIGVKKKRHILLLVWFISTIICLVVFLILGIIVIVAASSKELAIVFTVICVLYKWYSLWIVKLCLSGFRSVREGYTNPVEDSEIDQVNNLMPNSDSFTVDKF